MYFQFQKMYCRETVGKGACITRRGAVRTYRTNTIMKKIQTERGQGGWIRIWNFNGY